MTTTVFTNTRRALPLHLPETLFDAQTIIRATNDDSPRPLTVAIDEIVGRLALGGIASLSKSDIWGILGGRVEFPFGYPSTSTATNVRLRGPGNNVVGSASAQGYLMTRPGSVIGISLVVDINTWTSGDVQAQVRLNNSTTLLTSTLVLSGTGNGQKTRATASADVHTFIAGDVLQLRRSLVNTPVNITTDDMQGYIDVEYD